MATFSPGTCIIQASRMLRAHTHTTGNGSAHDHRNLDLAPEEVMHLGRLVNKLVHGYRNKVHELEFHNGSHPVDRCADRKTDGRGFTQRTVANPLLPELFVKSPVNSKGPPVGSDVLPQQDQVRLAPHLLADRFVNCLTHWDLTHNGLSIPRSDGRKN